MNKKLALLATPIVALSATANATLFEPKLTPYIGADVQCRYMNFEKNYGGNLISHNTPQANMYLGVKFNDYFAIEAGYESNIRRARTTTLYRYNGDYISGMPLNKYNISAASSRQNVTLHAHGGHVNAVVTLPLSKKNRLDFVALAGIVSMKAKITTTTVESSKVTIEPRIGTFSKKRSLTRFGAGVQHMMDKNLGIRGMVIYENSSKINAPHIFDTTKVEPTASMRAKDSILYSIGAFVKF